MSVFDDSTKGQEATTNTNPDDHTTENWIERVVSEKGEQWTDPNTVAKGYYHAQKRIAELEELVKASSQNDYAKELLEQLKGKTQAPDSPSGTPPVETPKSQEGQGREQTTPKPEDIQSLIDKALSDRERDNTVAQNIALADQKLEATYGTEAAAAVRKRSQELGMSMERLRELAGESPTAFLSLMGEAAPKETNVTVKGTLNTSAGFEQRKDRDAKYYSGLRKENPRLYRTPKVQEQMMQDRVRLGSNFY